MMYAAHPLLNPNLPSAEPGHIRRWLKVYRRLQRNAGSADSFLKCLADCDSPVGLVPDATINSSLRDADAYLDDILRHVPAEQRNFLRPLETTRSLNELVPLLRACFAGPNPRLRYEAQRKLYLGKLLFTIDHCRPVRDGQRHKTILAAHLSENLFSGAREGPETEVCCRFDPQEEGGRLEFDSASAPGARCWNFRVRKLAAVKGKPDIEVFHYGIRFKRDVAPSAPAESGAGQLRLGETAGWPGLGRRSGSILTKMISRGITDPNQVPDVLGALFIVGDREQAYALERRLLRVLGGTVWVRDRTDTLTGERDRAKLSSRSASGFEVLKETVDILVGSASNALPYQFAVELQIYPLAAYLATIHDAHYASHAAYKRRQLVKDVLPLVFPVSIFGAAAKMRASAF